jgi:hypothetical protein
VSRDFTLWTGLLTGPTAWLISFEARFALAQWACATHGKVALYAISALALVITAVSGLLAWREWNGVGQETPGDAEGPIPRQRIMAIGGVLLSGLTVLLIVAQAIPEVLLRPCD